MINLQGLGASSDYDTLLIGGVSYSANEIVDRQITAKKDTKVYRGDLKTYVRTIKAGQIIGYVYSYLKATQTPTGIAALMMYDNRDYTGSPYYVIDESAINTDALSQQGAQTLAQEQQAEADAKEKENDPVLYYVKKIGKPVIIWGSVLFVGGIVIKELFSIGRESLRKKAGLTGVKRKRKSKKKK